VHTGIFVADILDEKQDQDIVLILAGVHAAAKFVAACPERRVEFGFLKGHAYTPVCFPSGAISAFRGKSEKGGTSLLAQGTPLWQHDWD
jgi:hypothetical protein